ncbi:hypothetical protein Gpo141_00005405 [Globisporangium polare]
MAGETSKDPFASEPLLRTAEQLQSAIKSARRRRSSLARASAIQSSPRTSHSHSERSATFQDHESDDGFGELDDKENVAQNGPRDSSKVRIDGNVFNARRESISKRLHRERLSRQTTQSLSDDMLLDLSCRSDGDVDGSIDGASDESSHCGMREWERRDILRMSELSLSGMSQSDLKPRQSRNMTRSEMDKSIGEMTRRALDWMQQDTEKQAKENKAMQELLHGVICIINDVVADLALPSDDGLSGILTGAGSACRHISEFKHRKELSIDNVDKLVSEWENALLEWRKRAMDAKNEAPALMKRIVDLTTLTRQQQMLCEDYASAGSDAAPRAPDAFDPPALQPLSSSYTTLLSGSSHAPPFRDRDEMDLKAQLKVAELCSLRWQMAFEHQATSSHQLQERLGMLLEESTIARVELQEHKTRLAKMIHVDALKVYQQKIALLEDQVHDTRQQVACDHEQFLYEQSKWECEKRHLGKDVEEIQDVSVKVLKVLLIRDKMMKKQERLLEKRFLGCEHQRKALEDQFRTLGMTTQELMQECALFLVALQEHATGSRHVQVPVKPIQIKKMLKRLRRLQHATESPSFSKTVDLPPNSSDERSIDDVSQQSS